MESFKNQISNLESVEKFKTNIENLEIKNKFSEVDYGLITKNDFSLKEAKNRLPENGGEWEGKKGDSLWIPDADKIPENQNPDQQTFGEILKEYGVEGIEFENGEPNFESVSEGNVEIDDFTTDRRLNFSQADEKMAEEKGMTKEEFVKWRKENGYTWHERKDCKTMDLVPQKIHNNIPHTGGISEKKKEIAGG